MSLESAELLREVRDLIADTFPPADLEMLVMDHLGVPLANLVSPGKHPQRVFELLQACEARGWSERLLDGVVKERQHDPKVALLMQRMGGVPALSSAGGDVAAAAAAAARTVNSVGMGRRDTAGPWYLEAPPDFARPDAAQANRLLATAYVERRAAIALAESVGVTLIHINREQPPFDLMRDILKQAAAELLLEPLLMAALSDSRIAAYHEPLVALMTPGGVGVVGAATSGTASAVGTAPPAVAAHALSKRRDEELQALVNQLDNAYARKRQVEEIGEPTAEIAREILDLKRRLRGEGGHLRAGDRLGSDGRYQLIQQVGRGGFAVVWKAKDRHDEVYVAIKVLHANLSGDSHRRDRFFRGARMMQKLHHPAVVRVLDPHCEDGGFWYFVMEFVTNGTLHDAVLCKRLAGTDALIQIIRVGEALAKAHAQRIVHRDIKPQNILLDEKFEAKLTDFDLVGAGDTTGGTRTSAMGTVIYAAPECLERPQEATARADVFGLGMTAVFALAGRALTLSTLRNPEPTIAQLDCSSHVKEVLLCAVAWEPEQRFADASEMVTALEKSLAKPEPGLATMRQAIGAARAARHEGIITLSSTHEETISMRQNAALALAPMTASVPVSVSPVSGVSEDASRLESTVSAVPAISAVADSVSGSTASPVADLPRPSAPLDSQRLEPVGRRPVLGKFGAPETVTSA